MLAVLYDVHGNLPALEVVLDDAREAGARSVLLGGDLTAFGAWPRQTLETLDELPDATWIRGNWERWLGADAHDVPALPVVRAARQAALDALPEATHARLGALPGQVERDGALYTHAGPGSDMDAFDRDDTARDGGLLADTAAPCVVFGHTHLQFERLAADGRTLLVNPGSVGLPFDGDRRAAYALRHDDGRFELRRVAYDVELGVAALRDRGEAWADWIAGALEQARIPSV